MTEAERAALFNSEETRITELVSIPFSDTGRAIIYELPGGDLGVGVRGSIGVDQPEVALLLAARSFERLYREVYPDRPVPDAVTAIDRDLADRGLVTETSDESLSEFLEQQNRAGRSLTTYCNSACKDTAGQGNNNWCWKANRCDYNTNEDEICTTGNIDGPNDGAFVWNESQYPTLHTNSVNSSTFQVPAWTWQWGYWTYSNQNTWHCLHTQFPWYLGNLGITELRFLPITCAHQSVDVGPDCD